MVGQFEVPGERHGAGLVIAVDGTSGSGKSSTCRGVADRLGLAYLDTGAMFRAVTWWLLREGVDVHDAGAVADRLDAGVPDTTSGTDPAAPAIHVDGVDVGTAIRTAEVTGAVSPVSTVPQVRALLLQRQRAVIEAALAGTPDGPGAGIVVEGRDIGSVVWPQAQVKVYLTADPAARAARRALEEGGSDVALTESVLRERDRIDSGRAVAPLVAADGAVHLDTTGYTLEEVVDLLAGLADTAREAAR